MLIVALLTVAKTWKQLKCPLTDEWMKNMCKYIPKMEYYSVIKKNEIVPFVATWMGLEIIIQSEVSIQRKTYDTAYMWNLEKNDINRFTDIKKNKLCLPKRKRARDKLEV